MQQARVKSPVTPHMDERHYRQSNEHEVVLFWAILLPVLPPQRRPRSHSLSPARIESGHVPN